MDDKHSASYEGERNAESIRGDYVKEQTQEQSKRPDPTDYDSDDEFDIRMRIIFDRLRNSWEKIHFEKRLEILIAGLGCLALIVYTVFSILQWAQIRWTNRLTREALDGNNSSLQQTLGRMSWQIQETHEIAKQTLTQAQQTKRLANNTHDLAGQATIQSSATKRIAGTSQQQLDSSERPWMKVDALLASINNVPPVAIDGSGNLKVSIIFHSQNVGHSPATKVQLSAEMVAGNRQADIESSQREMCDASSPWLKHALRVICRQGYIEAAHSAPRRALFSEFLVELLG